MVNFNVNWDRWIKSSVAKHFNDESLIGINENQTVLFIEGFERNTDGKKDWIEFRLDGPYYEETTKGHWKIEIEVNILVVVNEQKNPYRPEYLKGRVVQLFTTCFDVFKYGESEEDDNLKLGCFTLKTSGREKILTTNFGKVRPDTRQLQSSVEGHFVMYLD